MGRLLEVEYEKIFSPKTMTSLKGKSGESLRQMIGDEELIQTLTRSQKVLNKIIEAEDGYRDELEMIAAQMVTDAYQIIDYADIKIEAQIVGMGDLDLQQASPQEDPASPDFGQDDPEKMKAKRRIINGITQGASIRGAFGFMLFKEYLDEINPELVGKYNEILKSVFGIYDDENAIALMLSMLEQGQKMQGGESEMEYDEQNDQFVIKAKAICFPMLVHEIVKGLYEIVGTKGFGPDREKNQAVVNAVDKLENEPRDLQYGKFIYDAISKIYNESDIEDTRVRELLFTSLYKLPDEEFFPFIENAINEGKYDIQVLNNGEWQSVTDSYYGSKSEAEEALSQLQVDNPEAEYKVVYMGLKPLQKNWAAGEMRDIEKDLKKDDTGLGDLDEINLKQAIVAAGITLGSLLGTQGAKANIPTSLSKAATSISTVNAKSPIEKVIKGFEKEGYKIPIGEPKDVKIQFFKDISEDSIKIQPFVGKTETAVKLSIQAFAKANKINLMKSIVMINSDAQAVLIYSTGNLNEGIDDPVEPGILKKRLGKLSCSRVKSAKSKLKDKGTHYAKALQRYLNYHC